MWAKEKGQSMMTSPFPATGDLSAIASCLEAIAETI
jgi:hypothetical protein